VVVPFNKQECLESHLKRSFFKEGDRVVFKKPRGRKIEGIITSIERDAEKVVWSKDRRVPYFIDIRITTQDSRNLPPSLKTYESRIRLK